MLFTALVRMLSVQVFLLVGLSQQTPTLTQPGGAKLALTGTGRQLYSCSGGTWVSTGADAQLSAPGRGTVGHHYFEGGRPVFNLGNGGMVYAIKRGSQPAPGQGNIPWLTLTATSGPYSTVTRTNTQGGVAPAGGCQSGQSTSVPYSALPT
ncbi:hypothetical protein VP01_3211g3 [Puccinia sorghi]|uniref:Uncharacterized protein n=1 Tax=Puccinia sorghi TaxID=27349 RepID=A0A0L6UYA6_9BASI|nr:hypothetical protein VP01_3211g3 [Puccinia sorghi]